MVKIVPTIPEHIPYLAEHMRESDKLEIWLSHQHSPLESLILALSRSKYCFTCLLNGKPVLMLGVSDGCLLTKLGIPWLLGTDDMVKIKKDFIRQTPEVFKLITQGYDKLENYVHDENKLSKRWLKSLGFTLMKPELIGPFNQPFRRFEQCVNQH